MREVRQPAFLLTAVLLTFAAGLAAVWRLWPAG